MNPGSLKNEKFLSIRSRYFDDPYWVFLSFTERQLQERRKLVKMFVFFIKDNPRKDGHHHFGVFTEFYLVFFLLKPTPTYLYFSRNKEEREREREKVMSTNVDAVEEDDRLTQ